MLTRDLLLCLKSSRVTLDASVRHVIAQLRLARRGCRAGKNCRRRPTLHSSYAYPQAQQVACICDNSRNRRSCNHQLIPIVIGNRYSSKETHVLSDLESPRVRPLLLYPKIERHLNYQTRELGFGLQNIRSVGSKVDNVVDLMEDFRLDLLILSETWHEDSDAVPIKRLRGMGLNVIEAARSIAADARQTDANWTNHGGLAVISKHGINITKLRTTLKPTTFEYLCCRVGSTKATVVMVAIYRPGSQRVCERFYEEFTLLLESLATYNCVFYVAGDLNIHLEKPADSACQRLNQILGEFNLRQYVDEPTHELGGLLDVVIGPCDLAPLKTVVEETGLSDHKLVCWSACAVQPPPEFKVVKRRNWKHFDQNLFILRIKESELCLSIGHEKTASELAELYHSVIVQILDELAPVTEMRVRVRPHCPFYDEECRQARRTVRRAERAYRRSKGTAMEDEARKSLTSTLKSRRCLVKQKGRRYWKGLLQSAHDDTRGTWKALNSLLGESREGSALCPEFSAEDYHRYIDDKIRGIREKTASAGLASFSNYNGPRLTAFSNPTLEEVIVSVRSSPNKQCASDPLPMWLLKESIDVLAPFLTTLMAVSLESGEFPTTWKHAIVTPHLKRSGLDQSDVSNYRPVSNLPFLAKLLERIVNKRMVSFLSVNGLMPQQQSAYRRGHSTETAILKIFSDLVDATANGRVALLCLLDLSAAFDTVDHQILIRRLETSYGLAGQSLQWMRSYLIGRTQAVWCNGLMSQKSQVHHGVPQGSVLGPLLFILYVADISSIVKAFGLSSHSYADDGQIYSSCMPSDTERLRMSFTNCISAIIRWTEENRLALNPDKTEFLWISTPGRRKLLSRVPFTVGDATIVPVASVRLLGVLLDETLSFDAHTNNVIRCCHYQIRRVKLVRRYLTVSAAVQLVRAFVLSRMDYCNSVLLGLPENKLNRLQSVLNLAARVVFGCRWNDHITPLLRDRLHWLRVQQRIVYKRCWLTFRALYDPHCPEYLSALVHRTTSNESRMKLRSSRRVLLLVPPPSKTSKFGERSFSKGNPLLWNSLPDVVLELSLRYPFLGT